MDHYALVTGGSRNIGAAIAKRLTGDGLRVIVADRQEPDHEHLADFIRVDLTDPAAAEQIARAVGGRAVTRLVNNAGIVEPASLEDTTPDSLDR